MKHLLIILALMVSTACMAEPAQPVTQLTWVNPTTLMDGSPYVNRGGLKIYCDAADVTANVIDIPSPDATSAQIVDVAIICGNGKTELAMTAYNSEGKESVLSNVSCYASISGAIYKCDIPAAPRIN